MIRYIPLKCNDGYVIDQVHILCNSTYALWKKWLAFVINDNAGILCNEIWYLSLNYKYIKNVIITFLGNVETNLWDKQMFLKIHLHIICIQNTCIFLHLICIQLTFVFNNICIVVHESKESLCFWHRLAQLREYLLPKWEVLGSNPSQVQWVAQSL